MQGVNDTDDDTSEAPERVHATDHWKTGKPVPGPGGERGGRDTPIDLRGPWPDLGAN